MTLRKPVRRKPARGNTPVARCHDERSEVPCETSIQAGARSGRVSATRELRSSRKAPCEPSSGKLSSRLFSLFPIPLSVTDGDTTRNFTYHADGQLASANYGRDNVNRETVGRDDPQQLANELRVSVYAPDAFVFWIGAREDGGKYALPYIFDQEYDENGNGTGFPDWTKKGKWIRFDPE